MHEFWQRRDGSGGQISITRLLRVVRDLTRYVVVERPGLPEAEDAIWTPEEQADYELWEAEFGKASGDLAHEAWLDIKEAEFTWGRKTPSA